MKKTLLAALAIAGFAVNSHATVITANAGDVFLGFQDTVLNKDYVVDLGAGTSLAGFTGLNINSDLTTVFGANWSTDSNLSYGIFGITGNKTQVWASVLSSNNALPFKSTAALGGALSGYNALSINFNNQIPSGQVLTKGVYFNVGTGADVGTSTWTGNRPNANGGTAFGTYNASLEASVSLGQTLDVYSLGNTAGSVSPIFKAANGNALQITPGGVVQVVPEPSTYALFGFGALLLVVAYRRKARA